MVTVRSKYQVKTSIQHKEKEEGRESTTSGHLEQNG